MELDVTTVSTIGSVVGSIIYGVYTAYRNNHLKEKVKTVVTHNRKLLNALYNDFHLFNEIKWVVEDIYKHTGATRFLMLSAKNGKTDFNYASCMYEHFKENEIDAIRRYKNVLIDDDYRNMLKKTERDGYIDFKTDDMDDNSVLKAIYLKEGITHSKVMFLKRVNIDEENDRVLYCSISTHNESGFSDVDLAFMRNYSGVLRDIINKWL